MSEAHPSSRRSGRFCPWPHPAGHRRPPPYPATLPPGSRCTPPNPPIPLRQAPLPDCCTSTVTEPAHGIASRCLLYVDPRRTALLHPAGSGQQPWLPAAIEPAASASGRDACAISTAVASACHPDRPGQSWTRRHARRPCVVVEGGAIGSLGTVRQACHPSQRLVPELSGQGTHKGGDFGRQAGIERLRVAAALRDFLRASPQTELGQDVPRL